MDGNLANAQCCWTRSNKTRGADMQMRNEERGGERREKSRKGVYRIHYRSKFSLTLNNHKKCY